MRRGLYSLISFVYINDLYHDTMLTLLRKYTCNIIIAKVLPGSSLDWGKGPQRLRLHLLWSICAQTNGILSLYSSA